MAVELNGDPDGAAELLHRNRYDQAPVKDQGHVVGWVSSSALRGAHKVKSVLHPLKDSAFVSSAASISNVLQLLADHGLVFTVGETGLDGFVTPSDLNRHATRSHFYLLIADVEMALADIVRQAVPRQRAVDRIAGETKERWMAASAEGQEADAVEYLYIHDLAELFLDSDWGREAGPDTRNVLTELSQFRPIVMHPARQLTAGRDPAGLASLARRGEGLARELDDLVSKATGRKRWK